MDSRVKHVSGLGFEPGSYVTIKRSGEQLSFVGVMEKQSVAGFKGVNEGKKEKADVEKKVHIADIMNVRMNPSVESSSDYGTVVKTFIFMTIRDDAGFSYDVVLGGDEMKRIAPAYNDLISILTV